MARDTLIEGSTLTAIADAIREKTETSDVMYPSEMAGKIREISTGGIPEPITAGEFVAAVILDENTANKGEGIKELLSMTMKKAGTYRFKSYVTGSNDSEGAPHYIYLYKNGTQASGVPTVSGGSLEQWASFDVNCQEGDTISIYGKPSSNYGTTAKNLLACVNWDNGIACNVIISGKTRFVIAKTAMTASGIYVTIPTTATYKFTFEASKGTSSSSVTCTAQLYKNGKAINGATAVWDGKNATYSGQIACNEGDKIEIYGSTNNTSYGVTINRMKAEEVY